ncbi:MAG: YkgJ family cysteine cluster protein [Candidatus Hydrogenedentota bacterium]|nr:MAG: YkgJ family cysteine cluster protein [Candidatus Hydrogenedentota bacterium]
MKRNSTGPKIQESISFPQGDRFSCARCNRCCRANWIIGLTFPERLRLEQLYPDQDFIGEKVSVSGETWYSLKRRSDGACVFLEKEGCRIHREHGVEAKPSVCRRFPFFATRYNGVVYGHLSRMCPTVYDRRGAEGILLEEEAVRSLGDHLKGRGVDVLRVALSGRQTLSWRNYLSLEERLVELISDPRWPLDDAVQAGGLLLRSWGDPLTAPLHGRPFGDPNWDGSEIEDLNLELVMRSIAMRMKLRGVQRYVLATAVTLIESRRARIGRFWSALEDGTVFTRIWFRFGGIYLRSLNAVVDLKKLEHVSWPKRDRPDLTPLRRLIVSHLRRKILLRAEDLETGWLLLLVAYAVVKFYARASAVAAGRENVHAEDLRRGVEAAEYHLLLHRPLEGAAVSNRFLHGLFRKILFHPSFPSSVAGF